MASCKDLHRIRRGLLLQRMLPGLASMAGLCGASVPLSVPGYDLDDEWCEFLARSTQLGPSPSRTEL